MTASAYSQASATIASRRARSLTRSSCAKGRVLMGATSERLFLTGPESMPRRPDDMRNLDVRTVNNASSAAHPPANHSRPGAQLVRRLIALPVAVAALVAGCGSSSDSAVVTVTAPAPATSTASPADPRAAAARAYEAWARIANGHLRDWSLKDRPACQADALSAACADAFDRFAALVGGDGDALARIDVPADASGARDDLVREHARMVDSARLLAKSIRDGDQVSALQHATAFRQATTDAGASSQLIRARLGLPPAPDIAPQ